MVISVDSALFRGLSLVLTALVLMSSACGKESPSAFGAASTKDGRSLTRVVDGSDEVPIFPGAVEQDGAELQWGIQPPLAPTSYQTVSWRYFNVRKTKETLVSYYQGEMGKATLGWSQAAWGNIGDKISWGIYTKKSGETASWVVLNSKDDGSTLLAVGLGRGKNPG